MEKFSLYDLLGLLLPGVIFMFFCNTLNELFCISPVIFKSTNLGMDIGISLCLIIIVGAVFYTSNFYLVKKHWYNKLFGMYKHIADLFLEMSFLHNLMNETLNLKAKEWYKKDIFLNKKDFDNLDNIEKKEIYDLQDEYYDRMYYELEYHSKNESSKTFLSFYLFFRQTALACILLILLVGALSLLHFIWDMNKCNTDSCTILWLTGLLFFMLFISVQLAKWFRKRMVTKIYWAYFTHLNQK